MTKTDVIAAIGAGITGAITIFLYLTISLPLALHIAPINLYVWDASNILGLQAAAHDPLAEVILVGQGSHLVVSLIWGFVFVLFARRFPALLRSVWVSGIVYGLFVMLFMHYVVVPLGHAPNNPYTLFGFSNTFIAHTLGFGVPVAFVASRLMKVGPSPGSLKPKY